MVRLRLSDAQTSGGKGEQKAKGSEEPKLKPKNASTVDDHCELVL